MATHIDAVDSLEHYLQQAIRFRCNRGRERLVMAFHVDIIRNEPLAGSSHVLAQVTLNGEPGLELQTRGGESDRDRMWLYLRSRVKADPIQEPDVFLRALPAAIDSTYVTASQVHHDAECPYVHATDRPPLK